MNNSQKTTTKAIALFLSLGMMSSIAGCQTGDTGEGGTPTEQPAPAPEEGGEGGEG